MFFYRENARGLRTYEYKIFRWNVTYTPPYMHTPPRLRGLSYRNVHTLVASGTSYPLKKWSHNMYKLHPNLHSRNMKTVFVDSTFFWWFLLVIQVIFSGKLYILTTQTFHI